MSRRLCPACHRRVTGHWTGVIPGHHDSAHITICPASWEPYRITISARQVGTGIAA